MELLPPLLARPEFESLRHYVEQTRAELRLFQLAGKIASSFDQYLAFRPRLILDWERGAETHWQAVLWREVTKSAPGLHPPALAQEFSRALRSGSAPLPERVSFFGIATLPDFYVQVLQEIAQYTDVHLFAMQPTPEWWSDIRSEREELRARKKAPASAQLHLQFERGNPLLASWGKLGREFLEIVSDLNPAREHEHAQEPSGDTILAQVQRDIFRLENVPALARAGRSVAPDPFLPRPDARNRSAARSTPRALRGARRSEAARHRRHGAGRREPTRRSSRRSSTRRRREQRIPFTISDRGARAENGIVDTFLLMLDSAGSRFTRQHRDRAPRVAPVAAPLLLAEGDLETIRDWIAKTGIRWGIDAAHRAELGLPAFNENTLACRARPPAARLRTAGDGEHTFRWRPPVRRSRRQPRRALGNFAEFVEALFATATAA